MQGRKDASCAQEASTFLTCPRSHGSVIILPTHSPLLPRKLRVCVFRCAMTLEKTNTTATDKTPPTRSPAAGKPPQRPCRPIGRRRRSPTALRGTPPHGPRTPPRHRPIAAEGRCLGQEGGEHTRCQTSHRGVHAAVLCRSARGQQSGLQNAKWFFWLKL